MRKYFIALEWSLGEMLTVGSAIEATTDAERTYQLVVHVIAGLVYAYLIGEYFAKVIITSNICLIPCIVIGRYDISTRIAIATTTNR